jgi:hypothetical protein
MKRESFAVNRSGAWILRSGGSPHEFQKSGAIRDFCVSLASYCKGLGGVDENPQVATLLGRQNMERSEELSSHSMTLGRLLIWRWVFEGCRYYALNQCHGILMTELQHIQGHRLHRPQHLRRWPPVPVYEKQLVDWLRAE